MKISPLVLTASAMSVLLVSNTSAKDVGNWVVGFAQGYTEYTVSNGPGNTFLISCDEGVTGKGETKKTNIFIDIVGRSPPPNSQIQVFLDGKPVQLSSDKQGTIRTYCHACSDSFSYTCDKIRKSK